MFDFQKNDYDLFRGYLNLKKKEKKKKIKNE